MPSSVPLEDLQRAHEELQAIEMKYPEIYNYFAEFFRRNRSLGYTILCELLMSDTAPRN